MKRTSIPGRRRLAAVVLAFGMVVAMATPSAATYCLKNADKYIVCVDP